MARPDLGWRDNRLLLYRTIQSCPGIYLRQLQRRLSMLLEKPITITVVDWHTRDMEKKGHIYSEMDGNKKRLYVKEVE